MEKELEAHGIPKAQIGGRLGRRTSFWEVELAKGHQIASVALNGARVNFKTLPPTNPNPTLISQPDPDLKDTVVTMLEMGAIRELDPAEVRSNPGFYSHVFTVPKRDSDKRRFIFNLKKLNQFIRTPKYKAERLHDALALIQPGDWLTSVDITEAYHHVPFQPSQTRFLRFAIREDNMTRVFEYQVLPMGLTSSPAIYIKTMKVPLAIMRIEGIRVVAYVDDLLIISDSIDRARQDVKRVLQILDKAGFVANLKKSELEPTQTIRYLGMIIDTLRMTVTVPQEKIKAAQKAIRQVVRQHKEHSLTGRVLMGLIGKLNSFYEAIRETRTHLSSLKQDQQRATKGQHWDNIATLSDGSLSELRFWSRNLRHLALQGHHFSINPPSIVIMTDSSDHGFGASVAKGIPLSAPPTLGQMQGLWTDAQLERHINWKELDTIRQAVCHFASLFKWRRKHIRIKSDNIVAVSYVNRGGGRKPHLNQIMKDWSPWLKQHEITVSAEYLQGELNTEADALSREIPQRFCDWALRPETFNEVNQKWGPISIDLFAADHNKQVPRFVSYHPHPNAIAVDAFSLDWSDKTERLYANPPFIVLPQVLQKLKREGGSMVLVAPIWPTAIWWPALVRMAIDLPFLIPVGHQYLSPIGAESEKGPSWGSAVWNLSGDTARCTSFRRKLRSWWLALNDQQRLKTMTVLGRRFASSSNPEGSRFPDLISSLIWSTRH